METVSQSKEEIRRFSWQANVRSLGTGGSSDFYR